MHFRIYRQTPDISLSVIPVLECYRNSFRNLIRQTPVGCVLASYGADCYRNLISERKFKTPDISVLVTLDNRDGVLITRNSSYRNVRVPQNSGI